MTRKVLATAIGSALLLAVLAVPAAAVEPPSAIEVNAIPGVKIDICAGGSEVLSNLKYGRASVWDAIEPATQTWVIRKAAIGKCKGKKLARFTHTFEPDKSYTVVYWRPKAVVRMKVFENDVSIEAVGDASLTVRHAARVGPISAWVWQQIPKPDIAAVKRGPTFERIGKGGSSETIELQNHDTIVAVAPIRRTRKWTSKAGGRLLEGGNAYQAVFMGSSQKNMKVKIFSVPAFFE